MRAGRERVVAVRRAKDERIGEVALQHRPRPIAESRGPGGPRQQNAQRPQHGRDRRGDASRTRVQRGPNGVTSCLLTASYVARPEYAASSSGASWIVVARSRADWGAP